MTAKQGTIKSWSAGPTLTTVSHRSIGQAIIDSSNMVMTWSLDASFEGQYKLFGGGGKDGLNRS